MSKISSSSFSDIFLKKQAPIDYLLLTIEMPSKKLRSAKTTKTKYYVLSCSTQNFSYKISEVIEPKMTIDNFL